MPDVEREIDQSEALLAAVCARVEAMQALTQCVPVVVFVVDAAGVFRACVGRPLRHFAPQPTALIGQPMAELTSNPAILANVARALQGDAFDAVVAARGQTFETGYEPIHDAHGVVHGVLGMAVNITRGRQAEAALDQLREQVTAQAARMLEALEQPASPPKTAPVPSPAPVVGATPRGTLEPLTEREQAVLRGVAAGKTNTQIGGELHISAKTVAKHLGNVYAKLGVASRTGAAILAVREGRVE